VRLGFWNGGPRWQIWRLALAQRRREVDERAIAAERRRRKYASLSTRL